MRYPFRVLTLLVGLSAGAFAHPDSEIHVHEGTYDTMNTDLPKSDLEVTWTEPPEGVMIECPTIPDVPDVESLQGIVTLLDDTPNSEDLQRAFYQAMSNLSHYRMHAIGCLQGLQ